MAGSTTRRYISINLQSKENSQEIHLTNPKNQISGQISIINPTTQELENIKDIFFNKEDGQQIAESIKESVKEELQGEYITSQDADSRFVSKEDAEDFALKSDLADCVMKSDLSELVGDLTDLAKKSDLSDLVTNSELLDEMSDVVRTNDIKDFVRVDEADEKYLPKNKGNTYIPKSYVKNLKQIDITQQFTLEQAVGLLNELISALQGGGKVIIEDITEIEEPEQGEYQISDAGTAMNSIISSLNDMGFEIEALSQNYDMDELAERLNEIIIALQDTPDFEVEPLDLTDGNYTLANVTEKLNEMIGALTDEAN